MTDRKLFGTNTLVNDFTKKLAQTNTIDGGWTIQYIDNLTGNQWLKYVVDERGLFVNLIFNSPLPTTDELIEIAFNSKHTDEVSAAASRLNIDELTNKNEFRQKLIDKLNTVDTYQLDKSEKERFKTIILASQLTDRVNKREIIGKHFTQIEKDANFFNVTAESAENFLKLL